ncbi:hypothetical protein SCUP234_03787 [Seiridium cupressi]|uniref:Uncharacterized protein n=1 Tax=Seiridium unicorne TaxID=138068 RepID=A0ABR2UY74_9PEZI
MSSIINYQMRAHMNLLSHIEPDNSFPKSPDQQSPQSTTSSKARDNAAGTEKTPEIKPNNFWSLPTTPSPIDGTSDKLLNRVTTDIRISLKKPSPELEQDSEEFKRQAREIKKDIQRISKYKNRHRRKRSKSRNREEEGERETQERLKYEHEFRRRVSVIEGREFLLDFIQYHFASHMENITIKNTKTLEEIKMIGNEELSIGVRQCRRLFNAPVISDQVGLLLWQELRQGDALDHTHEFRTDDEAERDNISPELVRRKRTEESDAHMAEYVAERQATPICGDTHENTPRYQNTASPCPRTATVAPIDTHSSPMRVIAALGLVTEQTSSSIPIEKKAVDSFLNGVKKSAFRGASQFAASLASGYA